MNDLYKSFQSGFSLADIFRQLAKDEEEAKREFHEDNGYFIFNERKGNMSKFNKGSYIIGSVVGDSLSFSQFPKVHTDLVSVKQEAERLAKVNPGKEFIVVQIAGKVQAVGVAWS